MVLGLSSILTGLQGLFQGGGFGIGYGFGVRLGYDAYGGLKDWLTGKASNLRYSTNPFMSHLGSGVLSALGLSDAGDMAQMTNNQKNATASSLGLQDPEDIQAHYNSYDAQTQTNFQAEFDALYGRQLRI
jgi:hypothetical protein